MAFIKSREDKLQERMDELEKSNGNIHAYSFMSNVVEFGEEIESLVTEMQNRKYQVVDVKHSLDTNVVAVLVLYK